MESPLHGAVAAVLALHALLGWVGRRPAELIAPDSATYILLAKAVQQLQYVDLAQPGSPPHTLYPPGYPVLLGLWSGVVGERIDLLVALNIVLSTAALLVSWLLFRRLLPPALAVLCLGVLAVNPYLLDAAGQVTSEPAYMFFSLLTLWLLSRQSRGPGWVLLTSAAALVAVSTRMAGVPLVAVVLLIWCVQRRWRPALAFGVAVLLAAGGWYQWQNRHTVASTVERPYVESALRPVAHVHSGPIGAAFDSVHTQLPRPAQILADRVYHNVPWYLGVRVPWSLPIPSIRGQVWDNIAFLLLILPALAVGAGRLIRELPAAGAYLVAYSGLLVLWPWSQMRFLVPLLPLLVPAILVGSFVLLQRLRPWGSVPVTAGLALVLITTGMSEATAQIRTCSGRIAPEAQQCAGGSGRGFVQASSYVRARVPAGAVILSGRPAQLHLQTGQRVLSPRLLFAREPDILGRPIGRGEFDYVLWEHFVTDTPGPLHRWLLENCVALATEAYFPPRIYLFRVEPGRAPGADQAACRMLAADAPLATPAGSALHTVHVGSL